MEYAEPPLSLVRGRHHLAAGSVFGDEEGVQYVAANAKEALNFHISVFIYALCCIPLVFVLIGIPLLVVIGLTSLVLAILATIKASDGQCYRYPLTLRLVK